jgi:hypothetical protein
MRLFALRKRQEPAFVDPDFAAPAQSTLNLSAISVGRVSGVLSSQLMRTVTIPFALLASAGAHICVERTGRTRLLIVKCCRF